MDAPKLATGATWYEDVSAAADCVPAALVSADVQAVAQAAQAHAAQVAQEAVIAAQRVAHAEQGHAEQASVANNATPIDVPVEVMPGVQRSPVREVPEEEGKGRARRPTPPPRRPRARRPLPPTIEETKGKKAAATEEEAAATEEETTGHMLFPSPHIAMDVMCDDVYVPSYASGVGRGWLSFVWMAPHQCVHVRGLGVIFYGAGAVPDEWF